MSTIYCVHTILRDCSRSIKMELPDAYAKRALELLAKRHGLSHKAMLERLLIDAAANPED